jgi:hypothetical protein
MRNSLVRITQGCTMVRNLWKGKRWFRVVVLSVTCLGFYSSGVNTGHQEMDPRHTGGPGATVSEEQLRGHWDGVLTLQNGDSFCLVGWPCEDAGLDK